MTRQMFFHKWLQAFQHKQKSDQLYLKASRFNALNNQIKTKMIFQKLFKVIKREKQSVRDLRVNLHKKYHLHNYFSAIRYYPK